MRRSLLLSALPCMSVLVVNACTDAGDPSAPTKRVPGEAEGSPAPPEQPRAEVADEDASRAERVDEDAAALAHALMNSASAAAPDEEDEPGPRFTYQWAAKDGSLHMTSSPPPPGARLLKKIRREPEREASPAGEPAARDPRRATRPRRVAQARGSAAWRRRSSIGKLAPDLEGQLATGHPRALRSLRGEPLLVAFVSNTCGYCLKQGRATAELARYHNDLELVTVIVGERETAARWAERTGLAPASVLAVPREQFPSGPVPHSVVLDDEGVIVTMKRGWPGKKGLKRLLARAGS